MGWCDGSCAAHQHLSREAAEGLSAAPELQTAGAALANVSLAPPRSRGDAEVAQSPGKSKGWPTAGG